MMPVPREPMKSKWDVLFSPAEFQALSPDALAGVVCVVFDVLRATSTMVTALANGAMEVVPVRSIEEAVGWRLHDPEVLLGGERGGVRISAALSGGVEFDLGNSPREYTREKVADRRVVMTTTNGTRALRACAGAQRTFVGALRNRAALAARLRDLKPGRLLLVCSGTGEESAMEDVLSAGALAAMVADVARDDARLGDGWRMALALYESARSNLAKALAETKNGLRLAAMEELAPDIEVCASLDDLEFVPWLDERGHVRI